MKTPTLSPTDHAKLLISDMSAEEIESVIAYGKYWLHQLKKKPKKVTSNGTKNSPESEEG